jgi:hypothetical protein
MMAMIGMRSKSPPIVVRLTSSSGHGIIKDYSDGPQHGILQPDCR